MHRFTGLRFLALLVLLSAAVFAQSPAASSAPAGSPPAFEVADVHPSPSRLHKFYRGGMTKGDRFLIRDATMVDLIANTYAVDPTSVFGPQPWLAFDRFDIFAKTPAATSEDAAKLMLRSLLADRFKLVAHTDTRPLPAFVLTAGKTPKLKQADASADSGGCAFQPPAKDAPPAMMMGVRFSCHNTTMKAFAEFLHEVASPYLTRPVVDLTGLKGGWDFDIQWSYQIPQGAEGVTIFQAVDKQLGLKLDQATTPMPVVVVDSVNEKPTPNLADLEKLLPPPPPAQFDVAVIRPANPEEKNFNMEIGAGGEVNIHYTSVQNLIRLAYDIGAERMANKPKWLNDDRWDIVGKAVVDNPSPIPGMGPELDMDNVNEMLRTLLAERFKLVTHREEQPADVFALLASNPKMKKADPANHPSCKEGPGPDGKDPRIDNPLLNRLVSCQNMTMAQLAVELRNLAGGYVPAPVIDATGLDGAYDFTLSFSKKGDDIKTLARPGSDGDGSGVASDPLGGMSLFDAMQKQLGLKLEKREKVMVPNLVIDQVERTPTEN